MILDVNHLYTSYGLSQILFDVSLIVEEGECVSLLGRNGVGKTTTLRSIMGLTPPRRGQVLYKGRDITGKPAFRIAQMGLGFVPEDRRIFPDLTVRENLDVARKPPTSAHAITWTMERVYELFPVLANLENRKGGYLSGGEQQMLTIGRTLMGNPDLLLLDEPCGGLNAAEAEAMASLIERAHGPRRITILVEHKLGVIRRLCPRVVVLHLGEKIFDGPAGSFRSDPRVLEAYLGKSRS
jgi:branched-chain amino acid transport system ATP-binding protein